MQRVQPVYSDLTDICYLKLKKVWNMINNNFEKCKKLFLGEKSENFRLFNVLFIKSVSKIPHVEKRKRTQNIVRYIRLS